MYPIELVVVSHKCKGKHCEVCLNVQETSFFTSSVTNETYNINHQFKCNEKCLFYLLTYKKCLKQYVGQTTGNYLQKIFDRKFQRSEPCMQEHLFQTFSTAGHNGSINDVSVTFIDKADPSDPLKRENFWRETLWTMEPYGLSFEDSI